MATRYRIEVRGHLPDGAAAEFAGMTIDVAPHSTILRGPLADAAAMYGSITRLEALGLTLLTINEEPDQP